MGVLYQPAMRAQTEPQKQRGTQGPDFAFLRTSDHANSSWIYPIVDPPTIGKDISISLHFHFTFILLLFDIMKVITLQYHANVAADFIERHKHFQHEQLTKEKVEAILYIHRLTASAGPIVACNEFFVSYSLTSAPGASGGPVFSGNYEGFSAIRMTILFLFCDCY
jgi:hypothetical protein